MKPMSLMPFVEARGKRVWPVGPARNVAPCRPSGPRTMLAEQLLRRLFEVETRPPETMGQGATVVPIAPPPPPARPPTLEEIIADLPRPPRREESLVIWLAWSRWGR
jgi:hypothetical protein